MPSNSCETVSIIDPFHQNVLFVYRLKTWPTGPWNLPQIKSQFFSLGRMKREYRQCVVMMSSLLSLCADAVDSVKTFFSVFHEDVTFSPSLNSVTGCTVLLMPRIGNWLLQFRPQAHLILTPVLICKSCDVKCQTGYHVTRWCHSPCLCCWSAVFTTALCQSGF